MKKTIATILLLLFIFSFTSFKVNADSAYQSFEELTVYGGKLISKWNEAEYNKHLDKVMGRKFIGWNIHYVHRELKCVYTTETLYSFYNDGTTPIEYSYSFKDSMKSKFELSVGGNLGIKKGSSSKEKDSSFSNGLDAQIKASVGYSNEHNVSEEYSIKIDVDPQTKLTVYIYGEGKIYNGVAANYFFWIRGRKGSFEVFVVTTQYYRVEKTKI